MLWITTTQNASLLGWKLAENEPFYISGSTWPPLVTYRWSDMRWVIGLIINLVYPIYPYIYHLINVALTCRFLVNSYLSVISCKTDMVKLICCYSRYNSGWFFMGRILDIISRKSIIVKIIINNRFNFSDEWKIQDHQACMN